ncbi:MAG: glycosyltransferase family 2 protein [Terracidiphilus sp.]|jgi:glycosyltransferase involved in cell wall biosynthesis
MTRHLLRLPKISVVVPSLNQSNYLEATLLSILDQSYPDLELIVIDGGSTDGSSEIVRKYAKQIKFWCSEPDGGQTQGLIKGFSRTTGEIQCFLNSDDLFEPGVLLEVGQYFLKHPGVDAVYGNALWVDFEGKPIRPQKEIPFNRFIFLYTYNYIPGMSMFWRRAIYNQAGGLNPAFQLAFDADLWMRVSDCGGRIKHTARQWSRMRRYPDQKTVRMREVTLREDMLIRMRYWKGQAMPSTYAIRRKIALSIRIIWKLLTGCYALGYCRDIGNTGGHRVDT